MNTIAQEYALDIAEGAYTPDKVEHIAGVTNMVADQLSRRTDPHYAATCFIPRFLAHAKQVTPPVRGGDDGGAH